MIKITQINFNFLDEPVPIAKRHGNCVATCSFLINDIIRICGIKVFDDGQIVYSYLPDNIKVINNEHAEDIQTQIRIYYPRQREEWEQEKLEDVKRAEEQLSELIDELYKMRKKVKNINR